MKRILVLLLIISGLASSDAIACICEPGERERPLDQTEVALSFLRNNPQAALGNEPKNQLHICLATPRSNPRPHSQNFLILYV